MDGAPDNAREMMDFLLDEVLHGIELEPDESREILSYLNGQHNHLFGPHDCYFVLGSYERPFKFRLETALDELNSRHDAYAYLMAPRPDPDLPKHFPTLKLKFYLHALYADYIALILEHNTGGALAEFGRVDRKFLFERTHIFPRAKEVRHEDDTLVFAHEGKKYVSESSVEARVIEIAYHYGDDLDQRLEELVEEIDAEDVPTVGELLQSLNQEFGSHVPPDYSGVLTDGFKHFERVGRCISWSTQAELRGAVSELP